jgi:ABC-type nitrate/sulfonate/bicarbonate transport system substrate-binding protein
MLGYALRATQPTETEKTLEEETMTTRQGITRRQYLTATGAGALALGLGLPHSAPAQAAAIRQGYQTNVWGMPTYYLLRSGALEKRGLRYEEFAVPSGNLTMQQMVARQVDLGTYAGPSFILGHDKGSMVGIAVVEQVGRTTRIMARKDLNITKVEQLKGLKIANQTGSSIGSIFVDQIAPAAGLARSDWQEVRMDVNNMVAALAAKTVDAMINVEPYNAIAEAEGLATTVMDYWGVDKMPVFMAATPEFVARGADTVVAYLKAWLDVARDFKERPNAVADAIYGFYTGKGYTMSQETFRKALSTIDVEPGFPSDLAPYMQRHAEVLLKEKKIAAIPDWSKALRPEFMERARAA